MKYFLAISLCFVLANYSYAQNFLERAIKQKLEETRRQNIESARSTGDYSNISREEIEKEEQRNLASKNDASQLRGARINGVIDIKGIKIGMTSADVKKLLGNVPDKQYQHSRGCASGPTSMNQADSFIRGDYVIVCSESFTFGGAIAANAFFFFDNDKLRQIVIQNLGIPQGADIRDQFPPAVRALATNKFKIDPVVTDIGQRGVRRDERIIEYSWVDVNNSQLTHTASVEKHLSGYNFRDQLMQVTQKNSNQYTAQRQSLINRAILEQKQKEERRRAGDL